MTEFFASVNGRRCQRSHLYVGSVGPWLVETLLDESDEPLTGAVVVRIGSLELHGWVDTPNSFALERSVRIVGGRNGWGKLLSPKDYHEPSGVRPITVASDAARECGETIGTFEADESEPLGNHFVRRLGPGSVVLEQVLGGNQWWVDEKGITQGGVRPVRKPADGSYQVLKYLSMHRTAIIGLDDPAALWVGSVIRDRLSEDLTIRELDVHIEGSECRVTAFTGGGASSVSRMGRAVDAILGKREASRLPYVYRYKVHSDPGDGTLHLQAVRRKVGLPDVLPVIQFAGAKGMLSRYRGGEEVLIGFVEGDPGQPYVAQHPHGDPDNAGGIARVLDMVESGGPGTTIMVSLGPEAGAFTAPVLAASPSGGTVPVLMAGVRYLVSFGSVLDEPSAEDLIPPTLTPPVASALYGSIITASEGAAVE